MQTNPNQLQEKLAVITGASSGIGKAIAEVLVEHGSTVINADINEPLEEPSSSRYHFCKTDITKSEEVNRLYDFVSTIGKPNILVCNAGRGIHEKLEEGDPEKWAKIINLNLVGTLRVLRSFLPLLTSHPQPHIIFMSSVSAMNAYEYGGVYSATKAAINMVAETLRLEMKEKARITVIAPGVVDTNFFKNLESGQMDVESIGLGSLHPSEVADTVLYAICCKPAQVVNYLELRPPRQIL